MGKDITVCYSGGLDSTYVAYYMGKKMGGKIYLITLLHGYGQLFPHWSKKNVCGLKQIFGEDKVIHNYVRIKELYRKMTLRTLFKDYKRYKSSFIWCLGCHLSLHAHVIIQNLINSVPYVMLASSLGGQKYAVMSIPSTINKLKKIYKDYGIIFSTPLLDYGIDKEQERKELLEVGIWPGIKFRRASLGTQPLCIPGNLQHFPDTFFDIHPIFDNDKINSYIQEKEVFVKEYIEQYFNRHDLDIKKLIKKIENNTET